MSIPFLPASANPPAAGQVMGMTYDQFIARVTKDLSDKGLLGSGGGGADATAVVKGIIKLAGDLAGTSDAPTVPALASLTTGLASKADAAAVTSALAGKADLTAVNAALAAKADASALNSYVAKATLDQPGGPPTLDAGLLIDARRIPHPPGVIDMANPKYGLVNDGAASDQALGVSNAVADFHSMGGGIFLLPPYKFRCETPMEFTVPTIISGAGRNLAWWNCTSAIEQVILRTAFAAVYNCRISNDLVANIHAGAAVVIRAPDTAATGLEGVTIRSVNVRGFVGLYNESGFQTTVDDVRATSCLYAGFRFRDVLRPDSGDHKIGKIAAGGDSTNISTTCSGTIGTNTLTVPVQDRIVKDMTIFVAATTHYTVASVAGNVITTVEPLAATYVSATLTAQSGVYAFLYESGGGLKMDNFKFVKYQIGLAVLVEDFDSVIATADPSTNQNKAGQTLIKINRTWGAVSGQDIILDPGGPNEETLHCSSNVPAIGSPPNVGTGIVTVSTPLARDHLPGEVTRVCTSTSPLAVGVGSIENQNRYAILLGRRKQPSTGDPRTATWHSATLQAFEIEGAILETGQPCIRIDDGWSQVAIGGITAYGKSDHSTHFLEVNSKSGKISIAKNELSTFKSAIQLAGPNSILGTGDQIDVDMDAQSLGGVGSVTYTAEDNRTSGQYAGRLVHRKTGQNVVTSTVSWTTMRTVTVQANASAIIEMELRGIVNNATLPSPGAYVGRARYALKRSNSGAITLDTIDFYLDGAPDTAVPDFQTVISGNTVQFQVKRLAGGVDGGTSVSVNHIFTGEGVMQAIA